MGYSVPSNCLQKASFLLLFFSIDIKNTRRKLKKGKTTTLLMALTRSLLTPFSVSTATGGSLLRRRCASVARRRASSGAPRAASSEEEEEEQMEKKDPEQKARAVMMMPPRGLLSRLMGEQYGGGRETRAFLLRISSSLSCLILASERELVFLSFSSFRFRYKKKY